MLHAMSAVRIVMWSPRRFFQYIYVTIVVCYYVIFIYLFTQRTEPAHSQSAILPSDNSCTNLQPDIVNMKPENITTKPANYFFYENKTLQLIFYPFIFV